MELQQTLIGHAVDFFFCLSGFVLGYTYDDRLATLGLAGFLKTRLIRLHPVVIFGSVIGLIAFYANPYGVPPGYGRGRIALIFAASVLLVPWGVMQQRDRNLFSLNAPSWSPFWEYVANLVFALILYRVKRAALIALTLVAAITLCWVAHRAGDLSGSWSARNFSDGGARVAFSFCAGLLVSRMSWRLRTPLGSPGLSLLLLLAFVMPYAHGAWLREAAIVILYFPLPLVLGAGTAVTPTIERICRWSGELSYPSSMYHYAVIWIWGDYAEKHKLAFKGLGPAVTIGVLSMVAFAWLVSKLTTNRSAATCG